MRRCAHILVALLVVIGPLGCAEGGVSPDAVAESAQYGTASQTTARAPARSPIPATEPSTTPPSAQSTAQSNGGRSLERWVLEVAAADGGKDPLRDRWSSRKPMNQ